MWKCGLEFMWKSWINVKKKVRKKCEIYVRKCCHATFMWATTFQIWACCSGLVWRVLNPTQLPVEWVRRGRYSAAKNWPIIPWNVVQVVSYKVGGLKAEIVSLDSKTLDWVSGGRKVRLWADGPSCHEISICNYITISCVTFINFYENTHFSGANRPRCHGIEFSRSEQYVGKNMK